MGDMNSRASGHGPANADAAAGPPVGHHAASRERRSFYGLPRGAVELSTISRRLEPIDAVVDLARRRIVVTDSGITIVHHPIAVGRRETPTPSGQFVVAAQLDLQHDATGPYGPYAVVLRQRLAHGPPSVVVIHGTEQHSQVGQAVTDGHLWLTNDVALTVAHFLPVGTPVTITDTPGAPGRA